ncbi:HD-GYP domain-containing protein [Vibrio mimicus]|uniref:HD-GYP domain-containing protein n=1 Tax=Vibrio sp. RC586 TaxID=675815 RepID=UPI0001BB8584|nr:MULTISPECIES: HD-GYP domain-containing protein [Vibrio]EEY98834.1 metal-dependent phosphohydrolase [Vibrio sp. RC586]QXC58032.1 HD-GYP domain-containing protein [Vibrio mimicus]
MQMQAKVGRFRYYPSVGSLNTYLISMLEKIRVELPDVQRISFALYDEKKDSIKTCADSSPASHDFVHYEVPLNELPSLLQSKQSASLRVIHDFPNQLKSHTHHNRWLLEQQYCSSLVKPVFDDQTFIGFLFFNSSVSHYFSEPVIEQLNTYFTLIQQSIGGEYSLIHHLVDDIHQMEEQSPDHWLHIKQHNQRISRYAHIIATEIADLYGLDDELIENIRQFATCHDLGKLALPTSLLQKSTALASNERQQLHQHIESGIGLLNELIEKFGTPHHPCLAVLREIVAYHHEFLDGSGYPFGLTSEQIPIPARIITVANIFDALTTHRPYKQAQSIPHALLELEKMVSEGKLDRYCVNALRESQEELKIIIERFPELDPKDSGVTH